MGNVCRVCGNQVNNKSYWVKEMMLGLKEEFEYFQCDNCGCLQIKEFPENIGKYYPNNRYYSLKSESIKKIRPIKHYIKRVRAEWMFSEYRNPIGMLISIFYKPKPIFSWLKWGGVNLSSSILDVGSGAGGLLLKLRDEGFFYNKLVGLDPFISEDITYSNGVKILKKEITDIDEKFDFIMLHHSYEHMRDPLGVMENVARILTDNGQALIRIPLAGGFCWHKYGTDWVQIDAPRHCFLHTEKSVRILADKSNLKVSRINYDSGDFQFYGSELYKRGISLEDTNGNAKVFFTKKELKFFKNEARRVNKNNKGDQAGFYLSKN